MSTTNETKKPRTGPRRPLLASRVTALSVAALFAVAGCAGGSGTQASSGEGDGSQGVEVAEFITHSGPGGGSDVFSRDVAKMLQETGIVNSNIPVRNVEGGAAARALATMAGLAGSTDTVAAMTPTWLTTPLTTDASPVTVEDLTPLVQLITEPTVMAVRADSQYQSLQDFVDAAKQSPGQLVQVGGSTTSVDAISGAILQEAAGTEWQYLSFASGGERIAALLGGDADMMFGSPSDFEQQAKAGKIRVIAVIGDEPTNLFPDAPTLQQAGFPDVEVPQQFRGFVGPPDMSEEAVQGYAEMFRSLTETDAWASYMDEIGANTAYKPPQEYDKFLSEQTDTIRSRLDDLGLLADQG